MDLEKIKRFANSEFEGWKIAKAVTEVKNEIKNAEQGRDVVMSDVFKTLRDPLIEQQKKTDAKQDAVIDQLRQNQLALTGGIQDIVTLNRELPQLPAESDEASKGKTLIAELNNNFTEDELKFIKDAGYTEPNGLLGLDEGRRKFLERQVKDTRNGISSEIGAFKRKKAKTESDFIKYENNVKVHSVLERYLKAIANVSEVSKYVKKGSGIRKYKQPKRNAYKISGSAYGNLSVDVPKLKNEMKLNVFRGGEGGSRKLIYQADADKSLVDLLTKRFNPRRSYSMNAVKIFNDLNLLANLPRHPSSGKSKLLGSGVVYYNDPNELAERMKILVGSMAAGNNSPVIKNDLAMINDEFLKIGAIDQTTHEKFYKKYLK